MLREWYLRLLNFEPMTWKKLNKAKDTAIDLTNLLTLLLPVAEEKKILRDANASSIYNTDIITSLIESFFGITPTKSDSWHLIGFS